MVNYSKGLVYKLCCNDTKIKDIYVGSTTNFIRRKCTHKSACNNENDKHHNIHVYKFIRNNGGWDNWSMILLREYNATNKKQLERKEHKYIVKLKATLNCRLPTRTRSEYYQENQDIIIGKSKQYREANIEHIREQKKQYREANKESLSEQKKEYYKENKDNGY